MRDGDIVEEYSCMVTTSLIFCITTECDITCCLCIKSERQNVFFPYIACKVTLRAACYNGSTLSNESKVGMEQRSRAESVVAVNLYGIDTCRECDRSGCGILDIGTPSNGNAHCLARIACIVGSRSGNRVKYGSTAIFIYGCIAIITRSGDFPTLFGIVYTCILGSTQICGISLASLEARIRKKERGNVAIRKCKLSHDILHGNRSKLYDCRTTLCERNDDTCDALDSLGKSVIELELVVDLNLVVTIYEIVCFSFQYECGIGKLHILQV